MRKILIGIMLMVMVMTINAQVTRKKSVKTSGYGETYYGVAADTITTNQVVNVLFDMSKYTSRYVWTLVVKVNCDALLTTPIVIRKQNSRDGVNFNTDNKVSVYGAGVGNDSTFTMSSDTTNTTSFIRVRFSGDGAKVESVQLIIKKIE